MNIVKKIEIIAHSLETTKILAGLDRSGVQGHAVIHNVTGKGLRGESAEDLDMTMGENVYIIAFCMPEQLDALVERIKPILNKFGGTCYISDVLEIGSLKCVASV
jgi:nitrogen regulatory protein PII